MKKAVCFGGGNAVLKLILSGLKDSGYRVTSVTSMVDNGGSAGQFRDDFDVLPPGDIRRHLIALSDAPQWKKELFAFRFGREVFPGGHKGHNFANAFIGGLEYITGDYGKTLDIVHDFLEVKGRCLPATTDKVHVIGLLENGEEAVGEDEIDVPQKHDSNLKITKAFLRPEAEGYPETIEAIKDADVITIGPGDMYSSMVPCFLPKGIKEAICESKAKKIFVCPAMTKLGETHGFSLEDFVREIEKYIGCELDFVIYNTDIPDSSRIEEFRKEEPCLLEPVRPRGEAVGPKFIGRPLLKADGAIVYEPEKVLAEILNI